MKKIIAIVLASLVAVCGGAAALVLTHPEAQMTFMTNYVMGSLRDYRWSNLQMEDPVTPSITEALGDDHPESIAAMYTFLKDSAGKMTWEISDVSPADLTATVDVTYVDGTDFLSGYSAGLCDYIMDGLNAGTLEMNGLMNVLDVISDADNSALFTAAAQQTGNATRSTTITIYFEKKTGVYLPLNTSDEVNDVASAGLFSQLDGIVDQVAANLIPRIVDRAFRSIQRFDEAELEALTGSTMSELLGIGEDSPFYTPLVEYLRSCAGKIIYSVGPYRKATGTVEVACSFLDSQNVISGYLKGIAGYVFSHLTNPIPTDEANAQLLRDAIYAAEEKRVEKVVVITFDPENYGSFEISDEISDVVSANLQSELGGMLDVLRGLGDSKRSAASMSAALGNLRGLVS